MKNLKMRRKHIKRLLTLKINQKNILKLKPPNQRLAPSIPMAGSPSTNQSKKQFILILIPVIQKRKLNGQMLNQEETEERRKKWKRKKRLPKKVIIKRKQKRVEVIVNKRNSMNKEEAATKVETMKVETMKGRDTAISTTMEEVVATEETPVDFCMKRLLHVILQINADL